MRTSRRRTSRRPRVNAKRASRRHTKDKGVKRLMKLAEKQGWDVQKLPGGHIRFVPPDKSKPMVVMGSTPTSDPRALKNLTAALRRSGLKANPGRRRRGRRAAGVLMVAPTGRVLLLRRSKSVPKPGMWSVPAGGIELGEDALQAAVRELKEEAGYRGPLRIHERIANGPFQVFVATVPKEFQPKLNWENDAAGWFAPTHVPIPAHPGLSSILSHLW